MAQFQLFPPPPPTLITTVDQNPFRRTKSKHTGQGISFPLQTLVKSPDVESVVIQIIEEPRKVQPLPRAHIAPSADPSQQVQREPQASNKTPPNASNPAPPSTPLPPPPPAPASACSSSPTLVRGSSTPSQSPTTSPIVPMRSMFPTYNPSLPLSQQPYYPQRAASLRGQPASRQEYSPRVASPSQLDEVLGGAKTAPSSVIDFPMDDVAFKKPPFSSPWELESLWEATNGQEPGAVLPEFDLQMSRYVLSYQTATFKADRV